MKENNATPPFLNYSALLQPQNQEW